MIYPNLQRLVPTFTACTLLLALSAYAGSSGTPIASTIYGGNIFALVSYPSATWQDANVDALSWGGHLASLTTQQETLSVYNAFYGIGLFGPGSPTPEAWIGGLTTDSDYTTHSRDAWAWTDGDPWTAFDASNFAPGEPNGDSSGLTINRYQSPMWNDAGSVGYPGPSGINLYILEFSHPTSSAVPEPSGYVALTAVGLMASGALRCRC